MNFLPATTVAARGHRPVFIYDGECRVCRRWVGRLKRWTFRRVHYEPYQSASFRFPAVPREELRRVLHFVAPNGRVYAGAPAAMQAVRRARWLSWLWPLYSHVPGLRFFVDGLYAFASHHRN